MSRPMCIPHARTRRALTAPATAALALGLAAALTALPASAQSTTQSLLAHFNGLGANYPVQSVTDAWTFRNGSSSGALFSGSGASYYGFGLHQQIGMPLAVGTNGCTAGFCNVPYADTLATFNGVFVHPGAASPTAVVYRFNAPVLLQDVNLWTESVLNGAYGNGIDVSVGVVRSGSTSVLTSFIASHASSIGSAMTTALQPGLAMQAGDTLQVLYGGNGSYLYDHFNIEVQLTTSPVPEPGTAALWLAGLVALGRLMRRRRA